MSQLPSKTNIPVATPNKTKKVFTQQHLTTQTFMLPRPIFSREYIPGRNMKVTSNSFVRCNPLPVPIMGHAKVHNRAFFVPFRVVMPDWNEFYANTIYNYPSGNSNIPSRVPFFTNLDLVNLFIAPGYGLSVVASSAAEGDFEYYNGSASPVVQQWYVLTDLGVHFLTILQSLGYQINWNASDQSEMSALPLLAYSKIMLDWYYPSAYVGDLAYNRVSSLFSYAIDGRRINLAALMYILDVVQHITYNPDYFVNGWDHPIGPNDANVERKIFIPDITNNSSDPLVVTTDGYDNPPDNPSIYPDNGTPFVGQFSSVTSSASVTAALTQYIDKALKSLTDYTKRHQLAGIRVVDRYLSELGITLSNEILKRSMYLGSQEFDIDFFEVYSHAATSDAALGSFAGKGNGFSGDKTFDYDNGQEFGLFIVVNSIVPAIGYYQGQDKETLHCFAMDFYHPDFDHMAVQPISKREVYVHNRGSANISQPALNTQIWAFAPKYIEYNKPVDRQTGLYAAPSQNGLLPFYSLMRDLSFYAQGTLSQMVHNRGFVEGTDYKNYNRIFGVSPTAKGVFEGFNCIHTFDVEYYDSTLPAYDTYEFDDEENKKVTLDVNGSKLN